MNIQTISTKELREDFSQIKNAMERGESLLLLYRSKPLAQIKPLRQIGKRTVKPRHFSLSRMRRWIKDDQLSPSQRRRIYAILNRLP